MVVTLKCATNVMLAKASPLNPRVLMFCRSSNCSSFDVVCLSQRIGKSSLWQQKVLEAIDQVLIAAGLKKSLLRCAKQRMDNYTRETERKQQNYTRMPWPLSEICMSLRPPSFTTTLILVAPASKLFSRSSFSADAGR